MIKLKQLTQFREFILLVIIVLLGAGVSMRSHEFLTVDNLLVLLLSIAVDSIIAVGMTILMVSGGFDLSVGSTMAMTGAVAAYCLAAGLPVPVAIVVALAAGLAIGLVNGLLIARVGINPFITTLAMMGIIHGILLVFTHSMNISVQSASFKVIGQGTVCGVQYPIIIALVLIGVGDIALRKTRFLRQNYYLGGNEKAARLSGIPVRGLKIFNYALVGVLAAVAGVVMTARVGSASVTAGAGLELKVITAVIIGGASLKGGEGTVFGSFLGALLMAMLSIALPLLGVNIDYNELVLGATLLIAVLIDTLTRPRGARE
ncbi:MAG: ABC transporter permease [bacterium]